MEWSSWSVLLVSFKVNAKVHNRCCSVDRDNDGFVVDIGGIVGRAGSP